MAAGMGLTESSRGRHWRQALRRRLLTEKASYYCSKMVEKHNTVLENEASKEAEDEGNSNGFGNGNDSNYDDDDDDDDGVVEEIERRIRALKRLIPGGEGLGMEKLFEETAHYIEALEGQVTTMRTLATFLDGLHKERRLLHG
ncbi:Myc-type basic helix-loop-helix (bHLH) domain-containing protein [Dioscorea alata]|uniref:Myc-type basic helix-loop-helix (BHLH) domain-containing protein n=1 Tax=Dioscorea alata TaxID=55571 RepID=A0ACB7WD35_DIOAL|nr:Myc-type basic helix-loop-helix (bHLH) domain-containing protein [Dioscorea alata]